MRRDEPRAAPAVDEARADDGVPWALRDQEEYGFGQTDQPEGDDGDDAGDDGALGFADQENAAPGDEGAPDGAPAADRTDRKEAPYLPMPGSAVPSTARIPDAAGRRFQVPDYRGRPAVFPSAPADGSLPPLADREEAWQAVPRILDSGTVGRTAIVKKYCAPSTDPHRPLRVAADASCLAMTKSRSAIPMDRARKSLGIFLRMIGPITEHCTQDTELLLSLMTRVRAIKTDTPLPAAEKEALLLLLQDAVALVSNSGVRATSMHSEASSALLGQAYAPPAAVVKRPTSVPALGGAALSRSVAAAEAKAAEAKARAVLTGDAGKPVRGSARGAKDARSGNSNRPTKGGSSRSSWRSNKFRPSSGRGSSSRKGDYRGGGKSRRSRRDGDDRRDGSRRGNDRSTGAGGAESKA